MNHLAAYYLLQTLSPPPAREETPEAPPAPRWQRAAFMRGLYTARQTFAATRLNIARLTGQDIDGHAARIAHWEREIKARDAQPATPGRLKSVWSFLLHMAGYIGPVIAVGTAVTLGVGMLAPTGIAAIAGIATTCLINTQQAAGEAFLQTARNKKDLNLHDDGALVAALRDPDSDFARVTRNNVLLKSGISLAFTAAAGPVARLFGSFSNGVIHGILNYTPFGRIIGAELARNIENGILRSTHKSVGNVLANLTIRNGEGPQHIAAAFARAATVTTAIVSAARIATNAVFNRTAAKPDQPEKTETVKIFAAATTAPQTPDMPANDDAIAVQKHHAPRP